MKAPTPCFCRSEAAKINSPTEPSSEPKPIPNGKGDAHRRRWERALINVSSIHHPKARREMRGSHVASPRLRERRPRSVCQYIHLVMFPAFLDICGLTALRIRSDPLVRLRNRGARSSSDPVHVDAGAARLDATDGRMDGA